MSSDSNATPSRSGLSLYANLLDPSSSTPGSISKPPALNRPDASDESAAKKQVNAAALRFQPTKRPQLQQKQKPKTGFPKAFPPSTSSSSPDKLPGLGAPTATVPAKTSIADWTQDDDDVNGFFATEKRQRGGRKKKKRKEAPVEQNWDDIYDPSRPNVYQLYKGSDERNDAIREWKDKLYAHRRKTSGSPSTDSSSDEDRRNYKRNAQFAPPSKLNFAPPQVAGDGTSAGEEAVSARPLPVDVDMGEPDEDPYARRLRMSLGPAAGATSPPPSANIDMAENGDDAYARRMHLSRAQQQLPAASVEEPPQTHALPPAALVEQEQLPEASKPRNILERIQAGASISKAPILFNLPPAPADIPGSEAELEEALEREAEEMSLPNAPQDAENVDSDETLPRSSRPGQQGFAERLMAKYGYTKGAGLGAQGQGITTALKVKLEKRKKRPDAEGGGFATPGGKGTIVGGKKNPVAAEREEGKFGAMSEVVVLKGMLSGIEDVVKEMSEGLIEDIGEECDKKYGRVERVFVWREHGDDEESPPVFVKFTAQLSALRAVNALDGRIFNGNSIRARFFDNDKFERGEYA